MARAIPTEQYIKGVEAKLRKIKELDKQLGKTIFALHGEHQDAIFAKGLDGEKYSTKPILAGGNVFGNRNRFGNKNYTFATKAGSDKYFGSPAKRKDADWRRVGTPRGPRSLILIPGGYKAIREADGRQTQKVDLTHTGQLRNDFRSSVTKTSSGWVSGVRQKDNVGKLEGAIKRYGRKLEVPAKILAKYRPLFGRIMVKFITI